MPKRDRRLRAVEDDVWTLFRMQSVARGLSLAEWLAKLVRAQEETTK